jgi:hypothetical protein
MALLLVYYISERVLKKLWSPGLVLTFVSDNVWRTFNSCQIAGSVQRKSETGRPSLRISETVKKFRSNLSQKLEFVTFITINEGIIKMKLCLTKHLFEHPLVYVFI